MNKITKVLLRIISGTSDANISFEDLCNLLIDLGFTMHVKGSHHVFRKEGVIEKINIQQSSNKAKPYQVKQVRRIIIKYKFGGKF